MELKEIIEALKVTREETRTKVSDEVLFENAIKIFISERIGKQKEDNKVTIKQINYAKSLARKKKVDIEIKEGITKSEINVLIESLK